MQTQHSIASVRNPNCDSMKFEVTLSATAGKEAAAEALGALVWVSFADPAQRDEMRGQVLPALCCIQTPLLPVWSHLMVCLWHCSMCSLFVI